MRIELQGSLHAGAFNKYLGGVHSHNSNKLNKTDNYDFGETIKKKSYR